MTDHAEYEKLFVDWPELRPKHAHFDLCTLHFRSAIVEGWYWLWPKGEMLQSEMNPLPPIRDHIREVLHGMGYAVSFYPGGWCALKDNEYEVAANPERGNAMFGIGSSTDAALIALARAVMEREKKQ